MSWEDYERAFAGVDAPFALVDLDAMWANAAEMLAARPAPRSGWRASPCAAARCWRRSSPATGFRGLMTFTLPESLWLHERGFEDLLLAYPTADHAALAELGRLDTERPRS